MSNHQFIDTGAAPIKAWTRGVPVEEAALQQLYNVASLPFVYRHVAAMPDVHWGLGATVGSVIPTKGAIIPAAVGVDIGCGMAAMRTSLTSHDLPGDLSKLRAAIERVVPLGFGVNQTVDGPVKSVWEDRFETGYKWLMEKYPKVSTKRHPSFQLGSLGGGNHFLEICLDEEDRVWVMLHSGSRGIGNCIGTEFIARAKRDMERNQVHLPDKNLAYVTEGSEAFDDYVTALIWAQEFAAANREIMMARVLRVLRKAFKRFRTDKTAINCHHNYAVRETHFGEEVWVTRKGAVRARDGDLGIIPGSMGVRSYIVRGKGSAESFHSCAHGAGRAMSRKAAKERFTLKDHRAATEGVECRKDKDVLDETPGAYKDIDAVMAAQSDLVEVVHSLKQVVCVKG
ncbi:MAG: RtcB family protein [Alphaproteobacteria bacterium]|nr:RtcB family protein [Alphaproteobacteria bacterium]